MTAITRQMEQAIDEWEQKYIPKQNTFTDAGWNGTMFETYGQELDYVMSQPEQNVWTWVDGDTGTWIMEYTTSTALDISLPMRKYGNTN
jgi:hypothetical protein